MEWKHDSDDFKAACSWVPDGSSFSKSEGQLVFSHFIFRAEREFSEYQQRSSEQNCFFSMAWADRKLIASLPVSSVKIVGTRCVLGSLKVIYSGNSSYMPIKIQITQIHDSHLSLGCFDLPIAQRFTKH